MPVMTSAMNAFPESVTPLSGTTSSTKPSTVVDDLPEMTREIRGNQETAKLPDLRFLLTAMS